MLDKETESGLSIAETMDAKLARYALLLISICLLLSLSACNGGRRTEKRDEATHVFIGRVKALGRDKGNGVVFYTVKVAVESVEKGEGIKPGDDTTVECYLAFSSPELKKAKPTSGILKIGPPSGSYSGVPKENDRIRVYAQKVNGKYDGIYPDWYDVIQSN